MLLGASATAVWAIPNIVFAPMTTLVRHTLADDAFYYFGLARHFPRPQFDQGVLTTGFHPLYWLLIGPMFRLIGGTAPIRLALTLLLAAHVGTGLVLWRLVRRHLGAGAAVAAGLSWMLDPHIRALALLGVETALVTFVLACLLLAVDGAALTSRRAALVGVVAGLAFLARTDSIVIAGCVIVTWVATAHRSASERVRAALVALSAGVAIAAPWLCYLAFRGALGAQDSQRAEHLQSPRHGLTWSFLPEVWNYVAGHLVYGLIPWINANRIAPSLATAVVVAILLAAVLGIARTPGAIGWGPIAAPHVAGTVVLFGLYGVVFHHLSAWYVLYAFLALWVLVAPAVAGVIDSARRVVPSGVVSMMAIAAGLCLFAASWQVQHDFEPGQLDKFLAVTDAGSLPRGARIGAMNDGLVGFYHPGGSIDLDGVVDRRTIAAARSRTMCEFLARNAVSWMLDDAGALARLQAESPGLTIAEIHDPAVESGRAVVGQRQLLVRLDTSRCGST